MAEIGPKEAQQRANGAATRAAKVKRKLIPYAGKPPGGTDRVVTPKAPRKRVKRTRRMKLYGKAET